MVPIRVIWHRTDLRRSSRPVHAGDNSSSVKGWWEGRCDKTQIALYDSTGNEFIASAFRAETSVKVSGIRLQPPSQFLQTHKPAISSLTQSDTLCDLGNYFCVTFGEIFCALRSRLATAGMQMPECEHLNPYLFEASDHAIYRTRRSAK